MQKLSRAETAILETLFEDTQVKLRNVIRRQLHDYRYVSVEDVMQETYCRACEHIRAIMESPNPEAWLIRTAHNTVYEMLRKLNKDTAEIEYLEPVVEPGLNHLGLDAVLPAATPDKDRDLLVRYFERKDNSAEIAEDLNLTQQTVRQRLKRAKDRLAENLQIYKK